MGFWSLSIGQFWMQFIQKDWCCIGECLSSIYNLHILLYYLGKPNNVMWTRLASTANAGASTITLEVAVDWVVGDEIVIATTGNRVSQSQNEQRTIASVSGNTVTLTQALDYKHLGETVTVSGSYTLEARAEVGLLSHNIVFRGSDNDQWHDVIEACPEGFDPGNNYIKVII